MKKLLVALNKSYEIIIEKGAILKSGEYIRPLTRAQKIFLISDSNVSKLYCSDVTASLKTAGFDVYSFVFTAGEENKQFDTVYQMVSAMADYGITRIDMVAALGGGVTGDLAGFAASIYMRGIEFVQISTSLLSDIDSSVGGKTGCDLKNGKNLIGSFHQPRMVIIDTNVLSTLPIRYFNDGMAEAIKYGVIKSPTLFNDIVNTPVKDNIEDIIYKCIDIKREIVENDEFEHGERKLLNFGHTLGHAIEKLYNFTTYSHGEAIAIGMVLVTRAAENNSLAVSGLTDRIKTALKKFNLPTDCNVDINDILPICLNDKKLRGNTLDLIIAKDIGKSEIFSIKTEKLSDFFKGVN